MFSCWWHGWFFCWSSYLCVFRLMNCVNSNSQTLSGLWLLVFKWYIVSNDPLVQEYWWKVLMNNFWMMHDLMKGVLYSTDGYSLSWNFSNVHFFFTYLRCCVFYVLLCVHLLFDLNSSRQCWWGDWQTCYEGFG